MEQVFQLQQQIQRLRHEVNNIAQMTSELQQFEQNNAAELQRLQQHEVNATQQLHRIQQNCQQLNHDLNQMNSTTQQLTQNMGPTMGSHMGQNMGFSGQNQQFGTFGTQFTPGWSSGTNTRWSGSTTSPGWGNPMTSQSFSNSFIPMQQQRFNTGLGASNYYTPMSGGMNMQQGFAQENNMPSQSYAENRQISLQAQQALDNRVNRATQGLFGTNNQIHSYGSSF